MTGDEVADVGVEEITKRADAERLSRITMRAVNGETGLFNPFQGRIFIHPDGTVKCMGRERQNEIRQRRKRYLRSL